MRSDSDLHTNKIEKLHITLRREKRYGLLLLTPTIPAHTQEDPHKKSLVCLYFLTHNFDSLNRNNCCECESKKENRLKIVVIYICNVMYN
jgi:hypothetical protein